MSIRKKIYTQAYFLINTNHAFEYSFGVRLKYVGLNGMVAGYALGRTLFDSKRAKAAYDEEF